MAEIDTIAACNIFNIENCQLPIGTEYWFRNTGKELCVPFYLDTDEEISVKISGSDKKVVKEMKLNAVKGLTFVEWNLMLDEESLTQPGNYQLQLAGKNFKAEKSFEIKESERRR